MISYTARNGTDAVVQDWDGLIIGPEYVDEWAAYQAWRAKGNTPNPVPPDPVVVPPKVSMWAAKAVLQQQNLLTQANAAVQNANNPVLTNFWEYGTEIIRSSATLASLATTIGLTSDQVDQLFISAGNLTI